MPCSDDRFPEAPLPPLPGVVLVTMEQRHVKQVAAIEAESFSAPWRPEHFAYEIRNAGFRINLVAESGGEVAAYFCGWRLFDELKINNLAVHAGFRRRGLARWILRGELARARAAGCTRATLEVRPSNAAALALYSAHGFSTVGRRKGYYDGGREDAILMELNW